MAGIKELSCPMCSAPVSVQAGVTQATCNYCHAFLSVEFDHGEAVLHSAEHISGTIREVGLGRFCGQIESRPLAPPGQVPVGCKNSIQLLSCHVLACPGQV